MRKNLKTKKPRLGGTVEEHSQVDVTREGGELGIQFQNSIHDVTFQKVRLIWGKMV